MNIAGWGYFLYDLAPLLWQLKGDRPDDYPMLEEALCQGYACARAVTEPERALLEPFIAARQLASCRWLLGHWDHPDLREMAPALLHARFAELEAFLTTGRLDRNTATL